jgi:tetratricopeptide (TPR) repeat protein
VAKDFIDEELLQNPAQSPADRASFGPAPAKAAFNRSMALAGSPKFWSAVAAAVLLAYVVREIHRDALVIDPLVVPQRLVDVGITGEEFSNRTADEMRRIENASHTITQTDHLVAAKDTAIADIEIPGTSLGLKSVVDLVRTLLGVYPTRVSGGISTEMDAPASAGGTKTATLTLYIDRNGERSAPFKISANAGDVDALASQAALQIVRTINPYIYAAYEAHRHHYTDSLSAIEAIVFNPASSPNQRKEAYSLWGLILLTQGRDDDAIEKYKRAIEIDPFFATAYNNWGVLYERQNRHDDAVKEFKAAIARNSKFTAAYDNWGLVLAKQQKYTDAVDKYQQALEANPLDGRAHDFWGSALSAQKQYDPAIEQYKMALSTNPSDAGAYRRWADALACEKHPDEAVAMYQKSVAADPEDPSLYLLYADGLRLMERDQDAVGQYSRALEMDAALIPAHNNLGIALHKLKRYEDAIEEYRKALALKPRYALAFSNWGEVLKDEGKPREALEMYKRALEIDPNLRDAYENAATAYGLLGEREHAEEMTAKAKELKPSANSC